MEIPEKISELPKKDERNLLIMYKFMQSLKVRFGQSLTPLLGIALICVLLIVLFIISQFSALSKREVHNPDPNSANIGSVRNGADALAYLSQYGWEAAETPSIKSVQIPDKFDALYQEYSDLQSQQGFDLEPYRSKTVTMYTFRLLNHPAAGTSQSAIYANVLVFNGNVIAGDVVSYAMDGFITGLNPELQEL